MSIKTAHALYRDNGPLNLDFSIDLNVACCQLSTNSESNWLCQDHNLTTYSFIEMLPSFAERLKSFALGLVTYRRGKNVAVVFSSLTSSSSELYILYIKCAFIFFLKSRHYHRNGGSILLILE